MAGVISPEKLWGTKRKRITKELLDGHDIATQLQKILSLENPSGVEDLLEKIFRSFTQSISVLNSCAQIQGNDGFHVGSTSSGHLSLQDSGDSVNGSPAKIRRGCYKRRKTADSRKSISSKMEDGYSWRKYGQKGILNSKYPRCYFRCTYKHDQGCQALKQVQQLENDTKMFTITYFGHHTCKKSTDNMKAAARGFSDSYSVSKASKLDSVEPKFIPTPKAEQKDETTSYDQLLDDHILDSAISWQDNVMALKSADKPPMFLSCEMKSDDLDGGFGVGYLCGSPSSSGIDVDMEMRLIRSVEFDNWDFHCDQTESSRVPS